MPTQAEVEYQRYKHQGFNLHKLIWSAGIATLTGVALAPFELLKIRAQVMQEGRVIHGWSVNKGVPTSRMFYEIIDSGVGIRGLWTGIDNIIIKSFSSGVIRTFFWCNIYNYFNQDPRSKILI